MPYLEVERDGGWGKLQRMTPQEMGMKKKKKEKKREKGVKFLPQSHERTFRPDDTMEATVGDVISGPLWTQKSVVRINATDNFFVALFVLQRNKITSAPVYADDKCVGMIDLLDLVVFALMTFEDRKLLFEREMLTFASSELVNKPEYNAHIISGMSMRNALKTVSPSDPVSRVVEFFSKEGGLHRVSVVDELGAITAVMSQTDLARHILMEEQSFAHVLDSLKVGDWAVKEVFKCSVNTEASKAFEMLIDKRVSALPICDDQGRLISSFSASDLKGCEPGLLFKSLQESVVQFVRSAEQRLRPQQPGRASISCKVGDAVGDVVKKLLDYRIHRVWVVDQKNVVIGVVAFSDIFSLLRQQS